MKIGYQGDVGSNSEAAAIIMAKQNNPAEFIPLISSFGVVNALRNGEIDFGVVAVENSVAGVVLETKTALENVNVMIAATEVLPIHHCLFKKSSDIKDEDIKFVASHPQALAQTVNNMKNLYPWMVGKEIADTAIGAMFLAKGELSPNTAVICRKNAGEMYGLCMMAENIEDDASNKTTFHMLKIEE